MALLKKRDLFKTFRSICGLYLRSQEMSGPYHEACPSIAKHLALGKPLVTYPV